MVRIKKTWLDGMDKEILRNLYVNKRQLTGNQIAKKVGLTRSGIKPRLVSLKGMGILKQTEVQGLRTFDRKFPSKKRLVKIRSPRSIFWGIDFK